MVKRAPEDGQSSWLGYIFSPKVLIGGVLGFAATHAWDYSKELRDASNKELSEARQAVQKYAIPTPKNLEQTLAAIEALEKVASLHLDPKAQDMLNRQLADLGRLRDTQRAEAEARRQADAATAKAQLEAEKAARAHKAAQEAASAKAKAEASAEAARQQEAARAAAAAARAAEEQRARQAARAALTQRWYDRAPK